MRIHGVASLPHYAEHVWAVWKHLPESAQGKFVRGRNSRLPEDAADDDIVLVGGFYDIDRARGNPVVYVEHGAGQSYYNENGKPHPAYHGSAHPENVVGYISPRQEVADSWEKPAVAVGSPVCDPFELFTDNERPVVAITFHWPSRVCPEAGSAYEHYSQHLGRIVHKIEQAGLEVIGHHHPRDSRLPMIWHNLQVRVVDVAEVRERADVLIVDNSSLAYEMCYLNRMVVSLNCPQYRRDVEHGLRFWEHVPGLQVDGPDDLMDVEWDQMMGSGYIPEKISCSDAALAAFGSRMSDGLSGLRAAAWLTARFHRK